MIFARTYVNHVRNICHLKLANPLTKHTLLVIRQIQEVFNTSRNKSPSSSVKAIQVIQETSEKVLDFKARQLDSSTDSIYQGLKGIFSPMLDSCSINTLSIEIYENQFSKSDFTHIHVYLFRISFLTTLNIYKDYFKCRHSGCKWMKLDAKVLLKQIVIGDKFVLVRFSLK